MRGGRVLKRLSPPRGHILTRLLEFAFAPRPPGYGEK